MSTINRITGTDASTMKVSLAGEAFIKEHEGLSLKRYELGDGGWTIGYGHFYPYSGPEPALEITREEADALFRDDIEVAGARRVRAYVTAPLTQAQFDALASMAFGLSTKSFRVIADAVNRGEDPEPYMLRYVRSGTNLEKGLRRMRAKEIALYRSEGIAA